MGSIWSGLRQQMFLGSEAFVKRMQDRMKIKGDELSILKTQRRAPTQSLETIAKRHPPRNDAIVAAYATGAFSYREIGEFFGLHLAIGNRRAHYSSSDATRRELTPSFLTAATTKSRIRRKDTD